MKIPRTALVSSAVMVGLGLLAFFPILFLEKCYDANDLLYFFTPWRLYLRDCFAQGFIPYWGPNFFCGQPFLADPQMQILYPPTWLTLIPSIPTGLNLFIILHWLITVFGMHRWLRVLGLSENTSRVGALILGFSGFFWWEIIHPPVLAAFAWLPWWFAALEGFIQKKSFRSSWFLGAIYAMLFLAGSFQITLGATYGGLFYLFVRLWENGANDSPLLIPKKRLILLLAAFLAGTALIGPQVIATQQFSTLSNRENAGKDYLHFNAYWSLQPSTIGQFVLPRLGLPKDKTMESAIQEVTGDGGQKAANDNIGNDYLANFGYLGVWVPLLVFFAFKERRRFLVWSLGAFALLVLLVCFGKYFFLHSLLCQVAPGFSILRAPFRFLYLYVLPITVLAALGYQALTREGLSAEENRSRRIWVISYAALFFLISLTDADQCWREIFALLLGCVGFLLASKPAYARLGRILAAVGLVGPLLLSGWSTYTTQPSSNLDLKQNVPWLEYVKPDPQNRRVYLDSNLPYVLKTDSGDQPIPFPSNAAFACGLRIADGYNPLNLKNYTEVRQNVPFTTYFKLTAIQHLVFPQKPGEIPNYHTTMEAPFFFYESDEPKPIAYAPSHWVVEEKASQRLALLGSPTFDPYQTSVLDQPLPNTVHLPDFETSPNFSAELSSDRSNLQVWNVTASEPLMAVFTETYYPGWSAEVDGQKVPLYEANHAFRAIQIPSGTHRVSFLFNPIERRLLFPFFAFWFIAGAGLFFLTRHPQKIL